MVYSPTRIEIKNDTVGNNDGVCDADEVCNTVLYMATGGTLSGVKLGNGVYKSVDSGANWNLINVGLLDLTVESLAVDLFDPDTLYVGTESGVYKSTNGGASWSPMPGSGTGITALVIDRNSCTTQGLPCQIVYAASETLGVYKSTDSGLTWSPMTGLTETAVKSLAIHPPLYLPGHCLDLEESCLDTDIRDIDPLQPKTALYAGTEGGHVFRYDSDKNTWVEEFPGLSDITEQEVLTLAVHPLAPNTLYAGTRMEAGQGRVFRSFDQGRNWNDITALIPSAVRDSVYVVDFAIIPNPDIMNETALATVVSVNYLSRDINESDSWVPLNAGLFGNALSLAIEPWAPTTMYVGTLRNGLFKTTDGGVTWSRIEIPL
jgi:photosystem II stability/assembly factor-like uncharacterized protein